MWERWEERIHRRLDFAVKKGEFSRARPDGGVRAYAFRDGRMTCARFDISSLNE